MGVSGLSNPWFPIDLLGFKSEHLGGKMVADMFEKNGWDGHFLGTNTPADHMLAYIQETKPDLVGLSLSVYFNFDSLKKGIEIIRSNFAHLDMVVGGQAFRWGGIEVIKTFTGIEYMASLEELENAIKAS